MISPLINITDHNGRLPNPTKQINIVIWDPTETIKPASQPGRGVVERWLGRYDVLFSCYKLFTQLSIFSARLSTRSMASHMVSQPASDWWVLESNINSVNFYTKSPNWAGQCWNIMMLADMRGPGTWTIRSLGWSVIPYNLYQCTAQSLSLKTLHLSWRPPGNL